MIKRFVSLSLVFVLVSSTVVVGSVVSAPPAESQTARTVSECLARLANQRINNLTGQRYLEMAAQRNPTVVAQIKADCARELNLPPNHNLMCALPSGLNPPGGPPGSNVRYMAVPPGGSAVRTLTDRGVLPAKHPTRSGFVWVVNCALPNNGSWVKTTNALHTNRTAGYPGSAETELVHPVPARNRLRACADQRVNNLAGLVDWKCESLRRDPGDPFILGAGWYANERDKNKVHPYEIRSVTTRPVLLGPNSQYYTRGARPQASVRGIGCGMGRADDVVWVDGERVRASRQVFCPGVATTHVNYFDRDPRARAPWNAPGIHICFNTTNCGYAHNQPTPQSGGSWGLHRAHFETWQYRTVGWDVLSGSVAPVLWVDERNQPYSKTTITPQRATIEILPPGGVPVSGATRPTSLFAQHQGALQCRVESEGDLIPSSSTIVDCPPGTVEEFDFQFNVSPVGLQQCGPTPNASCHYKQSAPFRSPQSGSVRTRGVVVEGYRASRAGDGLRVSVDDITYLAKRRVSETPRGEYLAYRVSVGSTNRGQVVVTNTIRPSTSTVTTINPGSTVVNNNRLVPLFGTLVDPNGG